MNNYNIEREIVKKYVKKNKQERIIYELDNPKKREHIIWKFAGTGLLKPECLRPVGYMSCKEMVNCLFELGEAQEVYFWGESYVGILALKQAVELAHIGEICIIYCGKGIAYYQGEQEKGRPPRFLLVTD